MDQNNDQELRENLQAVAAHLPVPIRTFFAEGRTGPITNDLVRKYRLHVDQGTILEREIIMLLLGLNSPTDFVQNLAQDAGLDEGTIESISEEINVRVFVPLQQQMRAAEIGGQASVPKASAATPPMPSAPSMATPMPKSLNRLEVAPENLPGVMMGSAPVPAVPPRLNNPLGLLEDHEEPSIAFTRPVPMAAPATFAPPQPMPAPPSAAAPRSFAPPPMPAAAPAPNAPQAPAIPIIKNYGVDPYREPIDPTQ